jgi:hypothetical protein
MRPGSLRSPGRVDGGEEAVRREQGTREESEIDQGRLIAVEFGHLSGGRAVRHDSDLEALFQQLAQVGFDAEIRAHTRQDDALDSALAQLQHQVVALWAVDFVRTRDDGLPVFDVLLVAGQPIGAGSLEAVCGQRTGAGKHTDGVHHRLDGTAELPRVIRRIVVVRRHERLHVGRPGGREEPIDVRDSAVGLDARADDAPRDTLRTQEVVLRIGDDQGRVRRIDLHAGIGQLRLGQAGEREQQGEERQWRQDSGLHV